MSVAENPFPGPFTREITGRDLNEDGTQGVRLACGHVLTYIISLPDAVKYAPCSECLNNFAAAMGQRK